MKKENKTETREITCIECPMGCTVKVELTGGVITSIEGNTCFRGKEYASNEVTCPRRVLTTTLRTTDGRMRAVKTEKPIRKEDIKNVMEHISHVVTEPKRIGEIVLENVSENINLVSAQNLDD